MASRKPVVFGVVFTLTREEGPDADELAAEVLSEEFSDEVYVDDTRYSVVWEFAPLAVPEGTRRGDV